MLWWAKNMQKQGLIFIICLFVSACGFEPMHGNAFKKDRTSHSNIQSELARVQINNIPDREGQFLRNELIDRFYRSERPTETDYILDVGSINETTYDLDITIRSDATRQQLTLKTKMSLKSKETGEVLIKSDLKSAGSFNVLESEFATRVSEQNTRENALNDLARQIELQISLYLKRQG